MSQKYDTQSRVRDGKTNWFEVLANQTGSNATRTSIAFTAYMGKGLMLEIKLANLTTTPTFTPKILVPDAAGGADIVLQSFTALNANGTFILTLSPYTLTGFGTEQKLGLLPLEWKLELTFGGTGSVDTRVHARYL